jgi:hypothetical protein
MPIKDNNKMGGIMMAYIKASLSHIMCIKIATIKPALRSMKKERWECVCLGEEGVDVSDKRAGVFEALRRPI